MFTMVFNCS
jgi:large subunit ribosomal protein L35